MDKILVELNKTLSKIKQLLYIFYNKLCFIFNKQLIIQKMYEPSIENRNKANEELSNKLSALKKESNNIIKNSERLAKENKVLMDKITSMQKLILKK